jgi:hypothetical protein
MPDFQGFAKNTEIGEGFFAGDNQSNVSHY